MLKKTTLGQQKTSENINHATAGKTQCVADRSKPLHLLQVMKTKKTFKIFDNLTCKRNVSIDCITNFNKPTEALQELQKRQEKIGIRTLKIYNHTD